MGTNLLTQAELNQIRGKAMVGHATKEEILSVFDHLDEIEFRLDDADADDMLGTEDWRHFVGLPDAD